MKIIGLCAPFARSGKTTFAESLCAAAEGTGKSFFKTSFANDLKAQLVAALSPNTDVKNILRDIDQTDAKDTPLKCLRIDNVHDLQYRKYLEGLPFDPEEPRSWRWHMVQYGTNYRRLHLEDNSVWIRSVFDKMLKCLDEGVDVFIIDDVRTVKEYEALTRFGANILEINRMDVEPQQVYTSEHYQIVKRLATAQRLYFNTREHNIKGAENWFKLLIENKVELNV